MPLKITLLVLIMLYVQVVKPLPIVYVKYCYREAGLAYKLGVELRYSAGDNFMRETHRVERRKQAIQGDIQVGTIVVKFLPR